MTIFFSATTIGFYNDALKESYIAADAWPGDASEISERWYSYLLTGQTKGKVITVNDYGQPVLSDPPAPTKEQYIAEAEAKKVALLSTAGAAIGPLKDAVDLGMATKEEEALLLAWQQYRVLLMRVDTSLAHDIEWPVLPA